MCGGTTTGLSLVSTTARVTHHYEKGAKSSIQLEFFKTKLDIKQMKVYNGEMAD